MTCKVEDHDVGGVGPEAVWPVEHVAELGRLEPVLVDGGHALLRARNGYQVVRLVLTTCTGHLEYRRTSTSSMLPSSQS